MSTETEDDMTDEQMPLYELLQAARVNPATTTYLVVVPYGKGDEIRFMGSASGDVESCFNALSDLLTSLPEELHRACLDILAAGFLHRAADELMTAAKETDPNLN